jgi:hypothetical protein
MSCSYPIRSSKRLDHPLSRSEASTGPPTSHQFRPIHGHIRHRIWLMPLSLDFAAVMEDRCTAAYCMPTVRDIFLTVCIWRGYGRVYQNQGQLLDRHDRPRRSRHSRLQSGMRIINQRFSQLSTLQVTVAHICFRRGIGTTKRNILLSKLGMQSRCLVWRMWRDRSRDRAVFSPKAGCSCAARRLSMD